MYFDETTPPSYPALLRRPGLGSPTIRGAAQFPSVH